MDVQALEGSVRSNASTSTEMTCPGDMETVPLGSSTPTTGDAALKMTADGVSIMNEDTVRKTRVKCSTCNYSTTQKSNLRRHERTHGEGKKCSDCDRTFTDNYELREHVLTAHSGHTYMCPTCGQQFKSRQSLSAHSQRHHKTGDLRWMCLICNKLFQQKSHYIGHMNRHHQSKPFSCSVCEKSFAYKSHQQRHEKTCKGDTKVTCNLCKKKYSTPQILIEHIATKHGSEKFNCACGKSYTWKRCLSRHKNTCPVITSNVHN